MPDQDQVAKVVKHIADTIGDQDSWVGYPGGWAGQIELALLDAVFSANARYGKPASGGRAATGVHKVIDNWREVRGVSPLDSLSALIAAAQDLGLENLPDRLDNRQTVPGGAMRKGVAVYEAAVRLAGVGVDHSSDLADDQVRGAALEAYTSVPGLGWVTFDYFLSLLGHPTVKADRMVIRFVKAAVGATPTAEDARTLLLASSTALEVEDPRVLDHAVWEYQSSLRE